MDSAPGEVTLLLFEVRKGRQDAQEQLIPLVYQELRRIAVRKLSKESRDHSLQPTALVHEAYLRLTRMDKIDWQSRSHFYGVAARQMRNVLVDHAKGKGAEKRGAGMKIEGLDPAMFPAHARGREMIALDDALERLAKLDERTSKVVELRFFAGLSEEEIAETLGKSSRTVKREWTYAKAWLFRELSAKNGSSNKENLLRPKPKKRGANRRP